MSSTLSASAIPYYRDIELQIENIATCSIVDLGLAQDNYTVKCIIDIATRDAVLQLNRLVACSETKTTTVEYPSTWWDHFKQTYFNKWLLHRFPARLTEIVVNAQEVFPDYKFLNNGTRRFRIRRYIK